jgi:integrase
VAVKGHFKKRGTSWYYWVELERGPGGERRQKSRGGFKTRKDAERAFGELRDEVRRGTYVEPSKLSLTRFLDEEWFPSIEASVRPTTLRNYRDLHEAYIKPAFGRTLLANVNPARLNAYYADLLASGRRVGDGGLAPKTVRNVHSMLHKALTDAMRWGHLPRNPASLASPPKPGRPEMKVWSPEQLRQFVTSTREDRLAAAWLLLVTTGMRRGEVLGLTWDNVDFSNARLAVVQSLSVVNYHDVRLIQPKTTKGRRSIALDPTTIGALQAHRVRQAAERLAWGEGWNDSDLVFTRENGSLIHPQRMTSWFEQYARDANLPRIRLHDLRHSYATAALAAGVPAKVVSERLGHASVMITLDTYSHVLPSMQEDAASSVARLILEG